MTDRLARQRWWIAGLYCLAAVLAQGFHTHHAPPTACDAEAASSPCGAGHLDSDGDVDAEAGASARGTAPAFSACAADCPSCEFTLSHQALLAAPVIATGSLGVAFSRETPPADPSTSPPRPRSRAPPTC